jgi:AcrR family transcriptional regulator
MKHGERRLQIVAAADDLFYRQGFEATTFADITAAVNISRGNLYHHFKAKDDVLDAVIEARLGKASGVLRAWEGEDETPSSRVMLYIKSLLGNWNAIRDHGCPNGTLCSELSKLGHRATEDSVKVLALYRYWLRNQFRDLDTVDDPDVLAMQVLSWSQGVATTSNAFKDYDYLVREVQDMCDWLQSLPTRTARSSRKRPPS